MSMFNDIDWTKKANDGICISNSEKPRNTRRDSRMDTGRFWVLETKRKWYGTFPSTPEGKWDSTTTQMVNLFKDRGHPVFLSIRASSRGILKKKSGRDTMHFNAGASNTELLFRITYFVNPLSIYGAATNCVNNSAWQRKKRNKKNRKNPWPKLYWHVWNHKE